MYYKGASGDSSRESSWTYRPEPVKSPKPLSRETIQEIRRVVREPPPPTKPKDR